MTTTGHERWWSAMVTTRPTDLIPYSTTAAAEAVARWSKKKPREYVISKSNIDLQSIRRFHLLYYFTLLSTSIYFPNATDAADDTSSFCCCCCCHANHNKSNNLFPIWQYGECAWEISRGINLIFFTRTTPSASPVLPTGTLASSEWPHLWVLLGRAIST